MTAASGKTIADAVQWATQSLEGGESPAVDARVLVCHVMDCQQSYLYTWPEKLLSDAQFSTLAELVEKRQQGYPVAYLVGKRGFWDLELNCNPSTLIPRPETELLVETALALPLAETANVCDLGTGTGAIALALASEQPGWTVTGVDRIPQAIELAKSNAALNGLAGLNWLESHWFSALHPDQRFDLIVTNPPYVENSSPYLHEGDVRFEPHSALTAGEDGLDDIRLIIAQAPAYLSSGAWLLIEHGYTQHQAINALLSENGFTQCRGVKDLNGLDRITMGQWTA